MAKKTPIKDAQLAMSGKGLASRVAKAEARALNTAPRKQAKAKPVGGAIKAPGGTVKPKPKFVADRQAKIKAAQAADRAAIAAMKKKKK